jgi:hypothetical protein
VSYDNAPRRKSGGSSFQPNKDKPKVRFNSANGKYEIISLGGQVVGEIEMPNQQEGMPKYQKGSEVKHDYDTEYRDLQEMFDTNPDLINALHIEYKKHIKESNLSEAEKTELLKLDKQAVLTNFMNAEKQIYDVDKAGILKTFESGDEETEKWDKGFTSDVYKQKMLDLGYSEDQILSKTNIAAFQAAYKGLADLSQKDNYRDVLGNWDLGPGGLKDEDYLGKAISKVDGIMGNTTIGQGMMASTKKDPGSKTEVKDDVDHLKDAAEPYKPSGWLRPDKNALAMATAFPFLSKKPPAPYTPIAGYTPFDPNFIEDLGPLQTNLGQTASLMRAANVADPRMRSAMMSKLNSTPYAGQIIGDIAAKNVGISNQAEAQNFQGLNLYDRYVAERKEQDYDKWVRRDRLMNAEKLGHAMNWAKTFQAGDQHAFEMPMIESQYPNMAIDRNTGEPIFTGATSPLDPNSSTAAEQGKARLAKIAEMKGIYPQLDDKTIASTLYPTQSRASSVSNRPRIYNNRSRQQYNPYTNPHNPYDPRTRNPFSQ